MDAAILLAPSSTKNREQQHVVIRTPWACRCRFTWPRICSPSWCSSSKCRNLHLPWSHTAPAHSLNQRPRTTASPLSRTARLRPPGPRGLNHCCKSIPAACALLPLAAIPELGTMRLRPCLCVVRGAESPCPKHDLYQTREAQQPSSTGFLGMTILRFFAGKHVLCVDDEWFPLKGN